MSWNANPADSAREWRLQLHANLTDHDFIQDPDDIPGGCLVCWNRLGEEDR